MKASRKGRDFDLNGGILMKRRIAIILTAAMLLSLASCGNTGNETQAAQETAAAASQEAASDTEPSESSVSIPNPWTVAADATEAAAGAGVGYFVVPSEGTDTDAGQVSWDSFRYMDRLAEANGSLGAAELTIRKGLNEDTDDVSGDYTEYAYHWQLEADGWLTECSGNVEGQAMLITWVSDNFAYSIMIRGQGDDADTYGIDENMVDFLVSETQ